MPMMRSLAAAVPIISLALVAQTRGPSARELLDLDRPLTSAEIATVLSASQQSLAAKTFQLSHTPGQRGIEVLMGSGGRPHIIRMAYSLEGGTVSGTVGRGNTSPPTRTRWHDDFVTIIDYTGRPARRCDDTPVSGDLVIEYTLRSSSSAWTVSARVRAAHEFGGPGITPVFEMLQGTGSLTSRDGRRRIAGHWTRAFTAPWTPLPERESKPAFLMGDPTPNAVGDPRPREATQTAIQSLWIDSSSLLPVRWEVIESGGRLTRHFDFIFEPLDLQPPAGLVPPVCVH